MQTDTYISIIFSIIIAMVFGNLVNFLAQPLHDKKKLAKISVLLTILLIIAVTIIYKCEVFFLYVSEIYYCIINCIPFFYDSLVQSTPDDFSLIFSIGVFFGVMGGFHCNFSAHVDVLFEDTPKIYFVITELIYILINTFLFILAYYILFSTSLYVLAFVIFAFMFIFSINESTVFRLTDIAEYLGDLF